MSSNEPRLLLRTIERSAARVSSLNYPHQKRSGLLNAATVLLMATTAWAGDSGNLSKPVTVCGLNTGVDPWTLYRAQGVATQLLRQADVRIEWSNDQHLCATAEHGIVVTLSLATPGDFRPGTLGYALPFEGRRIVLFYDRVSNTVGRAGVPTLLGHVLAHEIGHILQRLDHHAPMGIMKSHWNGSDYSEMRHGGLRFTADDIASIRRGLRDTQSLGSER